MSTVDGIDDGCDDGDKWEDCESGPFCRHWDDLGCEIVCAACGEKCTDHDDEGCEWKGPK